MNLTPEFYNSYSHFENYPYNRHDGRSYLPVHEASRKIPLGAISKALIKDDGETDVKFRDMGFRGESLMKKNVYSDTEMKCHLGDLSLATASNQNQALLSGDLATERDPQCRFVFLSSDDSRSKLKITKKSLARLLSYHQISSHYLELLDTFGDQDDLPDPSISGFRQESNLEYPDVGSQMPELGRSGSRFQMCYNLRAVASKGGNSWSVRAAAFCHQIDLKVGTVLWITACGASTNLYDRIKIATAEQTGRPADRDFSSVKASLRASFTIHLIYAHWALEEWRPYVKWIRDQVREKTLAAVEDRRDQPNRKEFGQDDLQRVQSVIEKLREGIIAMQGNEAVIEQLSTFYQKASINKETSFESETRSEIEYFVKQMNDMRSDFATELAKARSLAQIAADRKILILQFLQSQAAEKMEHVSIDTRSIAIRSRHEAVIVRIITIITLLFLPATFVSKTFFSTDVIKYQGSGEGNYSSTAMSRWLEVTVVLTFVTFSIAAILFVQSRRKSQLELSKLPRHHLKLEEV